MMVMELRHCPRSSGELRARLRRGEDPRAEARARMLAAEAEATRTERVTSGRERHVIIPPLSTLRGEDGVLTRYGRG